EAVRSVVRLRRRVGAGPAPALLLQVLRPPRGVPSPPGANPRGCGGERVGERSMTLTAAPQPPMQLTAERAPFVMLPRWLLQQTKISDGAKVLYCVLHDLVAGREGPTRPVTRGQLA